MSPALSLAKWSDTELSTLAQARQVVRLVRDYEAQPERYADPNTFTTPLHAIAALFQKPTTQKVKDLLRAEALPSLLRIYDAGLVEYLRLKKSDPTRAERLGEDLLLVLKMFALYRGNPAVQRIIQAAQLPLLPESFMWQVIFTVLVQYEVKVATRVTRALAQPLPPGFIGVTLLDLANTLAREHRVRPHPFDTPAGLKRLKHYLTDKDKERYSYAHSAAASIPYLKSGEALLGLAQNHPEVHVQMEAAWAAATLGDGKAREKLRAWTKKAKTRQRALQYLAELGDISEQESASPELAAMAQMAEWLEHPMEFGRPPDELKLYDRRTMYWPPTDDERELWLFRYRYRGRPGSEGIGMVGSITFSLFGVKEPIRSPEDAYALHCLWEMEQLNHPKTPKQRTVAEGRRLLGFSSR